MSTSVLWSTLLNVATSWNLLCVYPPPLSHTLPHAMYLPSSFVRLSLLNSGHLLISPWGWGGVALWLWAGDAFKNQLRQPEFFLWDLCYSRLDQVWCLVTGKWLAYILSHSSFWLRVIFFKLKYKMNTVLRLRWHLQLLLHHYYFTLSSLRDQIVKC